MSIAEIRGKNPISFVPVWGLAQRGFYYSYDFLNSRKRKVVAMGRPFYPHEAEDPDLDWLVSNFLYERPDYMPVEAPMLPMLLLPFREGSEKAPKPALPAPVEPVEGTEVAVKETE